MQFTYKYKVRVSDLWQASMYYAYSSYMGVVNAVCIFAAIVLIVSRWRDSSDIFRTVMVLFLMLFTVIQPSLILLRAFSSLKNGRPELELTFSRAGVSILTDWKEQNVKWQEVLSIVKKPTIMIVYMTDGNGYILRNSVLKETRNDLYDFVNKMLHENKRDQI
ncbi:MAG: hypothetical protein K6F34_06020 [Lachnospiraceae bacterium]|nr:hypothetical protein [Lachnospiraceae bacterium]